MNQLRRILRAASRQRAFVHLYAWCIVARLAAIRWRAKRPLLVLFRAGGMGDIIATFPSLARLKAQHPEACVIYCTRLEFRELVALGGGADVVFSVRHGDAVQRIAARFFETRSFHYLDERAEGGSKANFVQEMAESAGITDRVEAPRIVVNAYSRDELAALLSGPLAVGPVVALHGGPTAPVREWPAGHWQQLVDALRNAGLANLVYLSDGRHFLYGPRQLEPPRGTLSLRHNIKAGELARFLKTCDLLIGVDSGILQLAAAVGTPSVGLFGPVEPRLRLFPSTESIVCAPRLSCQFCHHAVPRLHWTTGCPRDAECMERIAPAEVLRACLHHLAPLCTSRS